MPTVNPPVEREEVATVEVIWKGPEERIDPPVMVSPEAEDNPPIDATFIPPAKVEVAVPEALIVEPV